MCIYILRLTSNQRTRKKNATLEITDDTRHWNQRKRKENATLEISEDTRQRDFRNYNRYKTTWHGLLWTVHDNSQWKWWIANDRATLETSDGTRQRTMTTTRRSTSKSAEWRYFIEILLHNNVALINSDTPHCQFASLYCLVLQTCTNVSKDGMVFTIGTMVVILIPLSVISYLTIIFLVYTVSITEHNTMITIR